MAIAETKSEKLTRNSPVVELLFQGDLRKRNRNHPSNSSHQAKTKQKVITENKIFLGQQSAQGEQ